MPVSVNTNVGSLVAQRNLNNTQKSLSKTVQRLSSGFRINSASDDAAGLAISEGMKSDIRGFQQAKRNSSDATSMLQTAEGALDDITGMVHRMRELAVQSASDGVSNTQRGYIQTEVTELQSEISRIADNTEYNGTVLLNGTMSADFQIGLDNGDTLNVTISQDFDAAGLGVSGVSLATKAGANTALGTLDTALNTISSTRASIGAKSNRLDVISNNISVQIESLSDANSRIRDTDVAAESAQMTKYQILQQAGSAMLSQANSAPQVALSLL